MSISKIQKSIIFKEISQAHYMSGRKPRLIDVMKKLTEFFSENPIGQPVSIPISSVERMLPSSPERFNEITSRLALNIEVLYRANEEQLQKTMALTTVLNAELESLKAKRNKLITQIDDYLFSLYNTDGYYFSFSDNFADLSKVDLNLTSAFISTATNSITIPPIASTTNTLSELDFISHSIMVRGLAERTIVPHTDFSPFRGCIDGLSNTSWSTQVAVDSPQELILKLTLKVGRDTAPEISRVEIEPYCVTPLQVWVETDPLYTPTAGGVVSTAEYVDPELFGREISSSALRFVFTDEPKTAGTITIYMRKTEPDYEISDGAAIKYIYMFGAKHLKISKYEYDNEAVFVSGPISMPAELESDHVIDSVSLVVKDSVPPNSEIRYFVADDLPSLTDPQISDFNWRPIDPLEDMSTDGITRVTFNGASSSTRYIKANPESGELQLIPLDTTNTVLSERNPSPMVIPGADVYRVARFQESFLPSSISIDEGVNSTKILFTTRNENALKLSYWTPYINGTSSALDTIYGRIDTGNEFFYGGDIGESGVSVYVETYLDSSSDQELYLRTISKSDVNSRQWAVKVYLNGREIADMPVGTDQMLLPWKFQEGLNHICMLIDIPTATAAYPNVYIGGISLMNESELDEFGTVKLGTWRYVDLHQMQYNEVDQPNSFTIHRGEIISRRKPSDNLRLKYSRSTSRGPDAVRVRADLSRGFENPAVSPSLYQYRLRFIYS